MTKKQRKHRTYDIELKLQAIRLSESGVTDSKVCEQLGIHDQGRIHVWRKKYQEQGEFGLRETRGRKQDLGANEDREQYIKKLEMENEILKKYAELLAKRNVQK